MFKKLIIASALCAGAAMTAQASANVTIYGIVDTGIKMVDTGVQKVSSASDGAFETSRLGFRGTEDLGSGSFAEFQLESQLNPSQGSLGSTTVATNEILNREAWVGLRSNIWGAVRVGRSDVTNTQNVDFFAGRFKNFTTNGVNGTNPELGVDQKNVVRYTTPTIRGLYAEIGYRSGNATTATTDAGGDEKGIFVRYTAGKLDLMGGLHEQQATATVGSRNFGAVGASYDFGLMHVGASYTAGDVGNASGKKNTATQLSVSFPVRPDLKLYTLYSITENGAYDTANKGTGYTLGVSKHLSKRTTLYSAYSLVNNQANSRMVFSRQGETPTQGGLNTSALTAGISHSF